MPEAFPYRPGGAHGRVLYAGGVALPTIAEAVGTPFYCYDADLLIARYRAFAAALAPAGAALCYSIKANGNLAMVRALAREGAGADVVSEGELRIALKAGIAASKIVFSGVGKTAAEMAFALEAGIDQFNVESEAELELLASSAAALGRVATIAVRVNPDIDAKTHEKIATGRKTDKFGVALDQAPALYARAAKLKGVVPIGVAVHIGSQLTDLAPFEAAFERLAQLIDRLRAGGHRIERLDLGGGLGIPYREGEQPPALDAYGALIARVRQRTGCAITLEPGRWLVGPVGALIARVIYLKESGEKLFAVVDAAMNDLIRPALYDAYHRIVPVSEPMAEAPLQTVELVGPVCESGDVLGRARALPPLKAGDLLAILDAGAYGAVMSSAYNMRPPAPEVMAAGGRFAVIRARESLEALIARDRVPEWLG